MIQVRLWEDLNMGKFYLLTIRFGSEIRGKQKSEMSPGPGNYKVPCTIQDVPRHELNNRNDDFRFI